MFCEAKKERPGRPQPSGTMAGILSADQIGLLNKLTSTASHRIGRRPVGGCADPCV